MRLVAIAPASALEGLAVDGQGFVGRSASLDPGGKGLLQRHRIHLLEHAAEGGLGGGDEALLSAIERCPPWRAKRRRVVPGSREATRDTRRAEGAKGDPKGASERGVQSYGRPVCSRNELAMLWRNAG